MPQRSRKPRPKVICVQCGEMKHTGGNLRTCNLSKGNRLLTRWHRARVRQGMLSSSKVAFVYSVQAALASEGDEHTQPATDLPGFPSI